MPMSEKNESYLFDLLESMNQSLKTIHRILVIISFSFSMFVLALFFLNS
jgi:hypothetical protein